MYVYMLYIYIGLINISNTVSSPKRWGNFLKSQIIGEGGFYSFYGGVRPYKEGELTVILVTGNQKGGAV